MPFDYLQTISPFVMGVNWFADSLRLAPTFHVCSRMYVSAELNLRTTSLTHLGRRKMGFLSLAEQTKPPISQSLAAKTFGL